MRLRFWPIFCAARLAMACVVVCLLPHSAHADSGSTCLADLETIPGFLLANDAGAKDEQSRLGKAHFDAALSQARMAAREVRDSEACDGVLNNYLKAWRKGHLSVAQLPGERALADAAQSKSVREAKAPTLTVLSRHTILLSLPTFEPQYRGSVAKLLHDQHDTLVAHPDWILDVRGNPGGDDSTYYPLLSWLVTARQEVQAQWLSTPANIAGHEKICGIFEPGDKQCESYATSAVNRMRAVATGTYINQEPGPDIRFLPVDNIELQRPSRVAVLIDERCGSSCEEFLLAVRQGFNVKLVGRSTFGSLDYSNLVPHTLPSAERVLWYATSRSCRLPDFPVDVAGIQPDIYLPQPANEEERKEEVTRAQSWLEGHSLLPTSVHSPHTGS